MASNRSRTLEGNATLFGLFGLFRLFDSRRRCNGGEVDLNQRPLAIDERLEYRGCSGEPGQRVRNCIADVRKRTVRLGCDEAAGDGSIIAESNPVQFVWTERRNRDPGRDGVLDRKSVV